MFYRILKEFFLKKVVSKGLLGYKLEDSEEKIKTIGILVDESEILNRDTILRELKSYNLEVEAIEVLVFKEKIKNKEVIQEPFYTLKDLSLSGKINKLEVQKFIEADFDLLINNLHQAMEQLAQNLVVDDASIQMQATLEITGIEFWSDYLET